MGLLLLRLFIGELAILFFFFPVFFLTWVSKEKAEEI